MELESQIKYCLKLLKKYKRIYTIVIIVATMLMICFCICAYFFVTRQLLPYILIGLLACILSLLASISAIRIGLKINSINKLIRQNLKN
jgi:hypothetical protein